MLELIPLIPIFITLAGCPSDITPQTIDAIIQVESSGKRSAVSDWGAVGLMQVTPVAVEDYNRRQGSGVTMDDVRDEPIINLLVGIDHLCQWYDLDKRGMVITYFTGRKRYLEMVRGEADYLRRVTDRYYKKVLWWEYLVLVVRGDR